MSNYRREKEEPKESDNVVELSRGDKCGKTMSERALKYSRLNVCPDSENKPPPPPSQVKQDEVITDIIAV